MLFRSAVVAGICQICPYLGRGGEAQTSQGDGIRNNAESAEELLKIYDNLDRQLVVTPEPMEITPLFAGLSILILLMGGALSLFWFGRVP